jgi:hypothetical protein
LPDGENDHTVMETLLLMMAGTGLAAAAGLRVFAPLLVLSGGSLAGWVTLTPSLAWIGTPEAAVIFGVATTLEVGAYYVPLLDHLLDTVATPAAVLSGILLTASVIPDLPPAARWAFAIAAGGGTAGVVQMKTVALRLISAATTGGVGNFLVATLELLGAFGLALLAILLPAAAFVLICLAGLFIVRRLAGRRRVTTSG